MGGQQVDLGDGVLGAAAGAESVGARVEVRLEDRLEHQLERGLDHPVPDGCDPQPALAAARLGDQPLPHRQRRNPPGLQVGPELGEERLLAPHGREVGGRLAIYPGRAGALVALDPTPPNQPERRITDEVVEVAEPTRLLVGCPLVQLGLDPQYPRLGRFSRGPRRAGIHRRPPGLPAPLLRTRCRPWPCGRLSRPRTTTAAPSRPRTNNRRRVCPPPAWTAAGEGGPRTVPTFTINRSTGSVPSCAPAASPRSAAALPRGLLAGNLNRRPSRPPLLGVRCALLPGPDPPDFEPVSLLGGFHHWFLHYVHLPVSLAGPGPSGSADPSRRCRGCSHPPLRLQG
jgi:hypothetical protein